MELHKKREDLRLNWEKGKLYIYINSQKKGGCMEAQQLK